jgi:lactoylglutathione lyase
MLRFNATIMKLNYIRLLTNNFSEMIDFYQNKLSMNLTHKNDNAEYAEFELSNAAISIYNRDNMAKALGMEIAPAVHECQDKKMIVIMVEDLNQTYQMLSKKNITFLMAPTNRPEWGTKTMHFRDPDGNIIEMYTQS